MEQSLFIEYVAKYFPGIVLKVVETLNGKDLPVTYLHRRLLKKDFSITGRWEGLSANHTRVMADVIALDSSLPLKKRDSLSKAGGKIPKMGMRMWLNETQLTELDVIVAQNQNNVFSSAIIAKIFADTPRVIEGIYERNEALFLEGFSTGITLVEDPENVGTGIRMDYGYLPANKQGVATLWTNVASKPWDDIKKMIKKAKDKGHTINRIFIDPTTLDNIAATTQTKELYAFLLGFVGANIPVPDNDSINRLAKSRYGFVFEIVDRTVTYERDGAQTTVTPWAAGQVIGVTTENIGSLIWARLAEQTRPVAGVTYQQVDDFIMVSKYGTNTPSLAEFTSSQARVVPVISGVERIYTIDSLTVQA